MEDEERLKKLEAGKAKVGGGGGGVAGRQRGEGGGGLSAGPGRAARCGGEAGLRQGLGAGPRREQSRGRRRRFVPSAPRSPARRGAGLRSRPGDGCQCPATAAPDSWHATGARHGAGR